MAETKHHSTFFIFIIVAAIFFAYGTLGTMDVLFPQSEYNVPASVLVGAGIFVFVNNTTKGMR